eukprot:scaffold6595_cov92-Skeletonema_marinoi.AAC.2
MGRRESSVTRVDFSRSMSLHFRNLIPFAPLRGLPRKISSETSKAFNAFTLLFRGQEHYTANK